MLLPLMILETSCANTPVPTTKIVPCVDLITVRPTNGEVDMMTEMTVRHILSNNKVIEAACK